MMSRIIYPSLPNDHGLKTVNLEKLLPDRAQLSLNFGEPDGTIRVGDVHTKRKPIQKVRHHGKRKTG